MSKLQDMWKQSTYYHVNKRFYRLLRMEFRLCATVIFKINHLLCGWLKLLRLTV